MPRRSAADLEVVPPDDRPTPLQPPADLGETERAIWLSIVNACQPKHFRVSDVELLRRYCQNAALGRQATEMLAKEGVMVDGKPNPWLKVGELVDKTLVALSMRLRISPQARMRRETTAPKGPPPLPWSTGDA